MSPSEMKIALFSNNETDVQSQTTLRTESLQNKSAFAEVWFQESSTLAYENTHCQ